MLPGQGGVKTGQGAQRRVARNSGNPTGLRAALEKIITGTPGTDALIASLLRGSHGIDTTASG